MVSLRLTLACALWMNILAVVHGHGRMLDPPGRSSMWRVGFNTPVNFDDNGLNCGYRKQPLDFFGANCGVCGDPSEQNPKENEAGGKFATGIISKYYKMGETIKIKIHITSNNEGFFEFRLCENNDVKKRITRSCLKHLLVNPKTGETRYPVTPSQQYIAVSAKLPENVTCSQCVLQWRYHTGKNGGNCKTCVDQEEFYACSDIAIKDTDSPTAEEDSDISPLISETAFIPDSNPRFRGRCISLSPSTNDLWCEINCNHSPPHCPSFLCKCIPTPTTTEPTTTPTTPTSETTEKTTTTTTPTTTTPTTPTSETTAKTTTTTTPSTTTTTTATTSSSTTTTTTPTTTTTTPSTTTTKSAASSSIPFLLTCVSVYPSVSNNWCNINCNYSPTFCPRYMCKCSPPSKPTTTTTTTPTTTTTTTTTTTPTTTTTTTTTTTPTTTNPTTATPTIPTTSFPV